MRVARTAMVIGSLLTIGVIPGSAVSLPADTAALLPLDGLAPYSGYRATLLRTGWAPIEQPGGRPGTPEASCGNALCTATWRGHETDVRLILWEDSTGTLVLAPSPFEVNAAPRTSP